MDGLPLAIELVAAGTKMLPPKSLLARLQESHLSLLAGGARDLPERHRTLRDAIGWSYNLLSSDEQTLFRRLGAFRGGFTLAAAEAVCNARTDLNLDLFEGVSQLLNKSLLKREIVHDENPEVEARLMMLETISDYALERLEESGEEAQVRLLHTEYLLAIASALNPGLVGDESQVDLLKRLDRDYDNVRAALAWTLEKDNSFEGRLDRAVQLGLSLTSYWIFRSHTMDVCVRNWTRTSPIMDQ